MPRRRSSPHRTAGPRSARRRAPGPTGRPRPRPRARGASAYHGSSLGASTDEHAGREPEPEAAAPRRPREARANAASCASVTAASAGRRDRPASSSQPSRTERRVVDPAPAAGGCERLQPLDVVDRERRREERPARDRRPTSPSGTPLTDSLDRPQDEEPTRPTTSTRRPWPRTRLRAVAKLRRRRAASAPEHETPSSARRCGRRPRSGARRTGSSRSSAAASRRRRARLHDEPHEARARRPRRARRTRMAPESRVPPSRRASGARGEMPERAVRLAAAEVGARSLNGWVDRSERVVDQRMAREEQRSYASGVSWIATDEGEHGRRVNVTTCEEEKAGRVRREERLRARPRARRASGPAG